MDKTPYWLNMSNFQIILSTLNDAFGIHQILPIRTIVAYAIMDLYPVPQDI